MSACVGGLKRLGMIGMWHFDSILVDFVAFCYIAIEGIGFDKVSTRIR